MSIVRDTHIIQSHIIRESVIESGKGIVSYIVRVFLTGIFTITFSSFYWKSLVVYITYLLGIF